MDYKITVMTMPNPIPVGTGTGAAKFEPWNGRVVLGQMNGAQLSTITISDDDAKLDNVQAARNAGVIETGQRLTQPATFGSGSRQVTVPEGTQMSFSYGSRIQDSDGNMFIATFPNIGTTSIDGTIVGGYSSVLIVPMPRTDSKGAIITGADGKPVYPVFDPMKSFRNLGRQSFGSANYGINYAYAGVDCFAADTMIDTAFGPRPVQTLREGDMIRTRDNGMRWLSWIGHIHIDAARLDLSPNLRPILIRAGALGSGLPAQDLWLSPQHRVLIRSVIAQRMFGSPEMLVAAKHLVGLPGITVESPCAGVTYWHLLFDGHELLRANGAWAESLYLGPQAIKGISAAGQREIRALFPDVFRDNAPVSPPPPARPFLTGREGRKLVERLGIKGRCLVEV